MCPTSCIEWIRIRGRDSEADSELSQKIRSRPVGVLKLAALPNDIPVDTISTHALRPGGTTTMFHAGYGLLAVKEWGRWKSSCFHGCLRCDMQTMRHVGKRMAVATGLLDYAQIKHLSTKASTFRSDGKKKSATTKHQSNYPAKSDTTYRDIIDASMVDIRKAVQLWRLVGNPETSTIGGFTPIWKL